MTFGEKLTDHRKKGGLTQEQLAEKLGISRQAISRWEADETLPDIDTLRKISDLFGVSADYLIHDDYENDEDIPVVQSAKKETETVLSEKKKMHLISAIGLTVAWFCALMGALTSENNFQLGLSCFVIALMAGGAIGQFILFFKKK